VAEVQHLLDGLSFGESLRWHQDRLWLADWGAQEVVAIDGGGRPATHWRGTKRMTDKSRTGQLLTTRAAAAGVGWP
jgi:hypothetical protein